MHLSVNFHALSATILYFRLLSQYIQNELFRLEILLIIMKSQYKGLRGYLIFANLKKIVLFCLFHIIFVVVLIAGAPPGAHHGHMAVAAAAAAAAAAAEARKPKLRRFNSHDTSSNMFSVADFENARLARRNEIELKQRLARRQRNSANCSYGLAGGCASSNGNNNNNNTNNAGYSGSNNAGYSGFCGGLNGSGDYSTGDSKNSKCSSSSEVSRAFKWRQSFLMK